MGEYRKKPVVIEAFRWTGGPDQEEDPAWIVEAIKRGDVQFGKYAPIPEGPRSGEVAMQINTLEGEMIALSGDWIIRGVAGEFYPCKPNIFAATYEPVLP